MRNLNAKVNLESMDHEHEAQLTLLDALEDAIQEDTSNRVIYEGLQQLIEQTKTHFLAEQRSMQEYGYGAYGTHALEHTKLMAEVRKLQDSLAKGAKVDRLCLIEALRNWLLTHIETADKSFGDYLHLLGESGALAASSRSYSS